MPFCSIVKFSTNLSASVLCFPGMCTIFIINAFHPVTGQREKVNLNFYSHTSFWCLKRFYEGLKGLYACMLVASIMTIPANTYKGSLSLSTLICILSCYAHLLCPNLFHWHL